MAVRSIFIGYDVYTKAEEIACEAPEQGLSYSTNSINSPTCCEGQRLE
ncbi:hypothetical protein ACFWOX_37300 [Streptomyces sp. NPDC058467]